MALDGGNSLFGNAWRKSSHSSDNSYCVEVAVTSERVGVRDTKDRDGGTLVFTPNQWTGFLTTVRERAES